MQSSDVNIMGKSHSNSSMSSACDAASHSENATQRLIRENVKQLIEQLEAGKSEALTAYLRAMANFRTYWRAFLA